ncbi:cobalt/nickel transport system ATP-binding protein [Desulfotomaculum arcticum]|uniref:ABC transporter ATP-binding protein n=1 Tax=Desulfotruncus arcticus DSM 17038 TaxID=1121424 RepID=A0A1I2UGN1_9FIRM|nr:ATP-binding cassette domain-containing protein [Desulfotruncus arcticus]SFG75529.1 cobalt/nickel transport system ATP-binding protein [Desulfotomaculum arcticum] [Desulfotruncus arcticus DSM 17038]
MAYIIKVKDLFFTYSDGTRALNGVSFAIEEGSRVAMLGPNGAGKSTLLLHLNGLHLPQQGSVSVRGREIGKKTEKWVRTAVGMVFQDPDNQVFSSTVWEDVSFGPINMGLNSAEINNRVSKALHAVGMYEYKEKPPYHLSYGQKKRVAIAGILAMEPGVIVLDEPMAYLDPSGKEQVVNILDDLHQRGITIIIATHDVDLAAEWADHIIIVKDGRVLANGGSELLTQKKIVEEASLTYPLVSRIFLNIPELAVAVPRTVNQAVEAIRNLIKR